MPSLSHKPITSSPIFLIDERNRFRIYPLAILDIKLGAHRVEMGYKPFVRAYVFPSITPFLVLTMSRNGQHFNIPVSGPDADTVGTCVHSILDSTDYAEDFIEHFLLYEVDHRSKKDMARSFGVIPKVAASNDNPSNDNPPLGRTVH